MGAMMRKMMTGAVAAAALGLTAAVAADARAQSFYMVQIVDRGIFLADQNSVRWKDGRPQIDLHFVYTTPIGFERERGPGYDWIQRTLSRMEYDCQGKRAREVEMIFYDFSGRQIGDTPSTGDWETYDADSPNALTQALACNNTPPSDARLDSLDQAMFVFYEVMNNPED